ncbi:MAG: undecaprenyldiphospho-muramoylpentapeptide beta-N-acetylglucosaminyltransferase [bacterium]|nr:undecaprenyldiphospho-muramoylpentapeptide beta-N-acetylglucosaminyltransferase [bacterium]
MRILFAGGGTAGHINPALAIAGYFRSKNPDAQILFVGNKGGMEERLVPKAGFDFAPIVISGFKRQISPKAVAHNVKTVKRIVTSSIESKKILTEFKPDLCVGTGGYVSGPVLRKAAKMGIPIIIHEQNAFPGVTTKMLSKNAKRVMLAIEDAKKYLDKDCNFVVTGNPVREDILKVTKEQARKQLGLDSRPVVLSFGGSLGARKINEALADVIARSGKDGRYQHIHAYGQYGKWFPQLVKDKGTDIEKCPNLDIREFIDDMPVCMAAADVVVSRAGAITLSEIQAMGKPAILIPSPNVAENHQYYNAMALVNAGAAEIIEEKDLTETAVTEKLDSLLESEEKLKEFSANSAKMAITDANERIYSVMKKILNMV